MTTIAQHVAKIEEWVEETVADREGAITADECYSDIVHAYLDSEIGASDKRTRAAILRQTGVGERTW